MAAQGAMEAEGQAVAAKAAATVAVKVGGELGVAVYVAEEMAVEARALVTVAAAVVAQRALVMEEGETEGEEMVAAVVAERAEVMVEECWEVEAA